MRGPHWIPPHLECITSTMKFHKFVVHFDVDACIFLLLFCSLDIFMKFHDSIHRNTIRIHFHRCWIDGSLYFLFFIFFLPLLLFQWRKSLQLLHKMVNSCALFKYIHIANTHNRNYYLLDKYIDVCTRVMITQINSPIFVKLQCHTVF